MWLQCCAASMLRNEAAEEVMDAWFWAEGGNMGAMWSPGSNPLPLALKRAYKMFDAGYKAALAEKMEDERRKNKSK